MIRVSTLIWVLLVALSGYAMFQVKSEVGRLDKRLAAINRQVGDDRDQIRTLNVEWAMLTQPQRLEMLSQHVLALMPIGTKTLGSLDQPPLRDDGAVPVATIAAAPAEDGAQVADISLRTKP